MGSLSKWRRITHTFHSCHPFSVDEVAEWLRRWTANPMCSARVGSNPILVGPLFFFKDCYPISRVKALDNACTLSGENSIILSVLFFRKGSQVVCCKALSEEDRFNKDRQNIKKVKRCSGTGNRTRACWVRASYPNH